MSSDAFAEQARTKQTSFRRKRKLPLPDLVKCPLNFRKGTITTELRHFFEARDGEFAGREVTPSAFCTARSHLKPRALLDVNDEALAQSYEQFTIRRWKGFRLVAFDGSTARLPSTPAILKAFGKPSVAKGPMARMVRSYDVLNRMVLQTEVAPYAVAERELIVHGVNALEPTDLALLDRGFPAFWLFALLRDLYAKRWPIEEHYKREKLRLEIENFSGKSPWIVYQDIYAKALAANLTAMMEWVTQALADERYQHRKGRYQVNFAELLSVMKNRIVRLLSLPDLSSLLLAIMEQAVQAVEQCGRNRSFPREPRRDGCRFKPNYQRTA